MTVASKETLERWTFEIQTSKEGEDGYESDERKAIVGRSWKQTKRKRETNKVTDK